MNHYELKEVNVNHKVVKHEALILAELSQPMNEIPRKLCSIVVSMISKNQTDLEAYRINVWELQKITTKKLTQKNIYNIIKEALTEVQSTRVTMREIVEGKKDSVVRSIYFSSKYQDGEAEFLATTDILMKPYLISLNSDFGQHALYEIRDLRKGYAIGIYEVLRLFKYQFVKEIDLSLERLRGVTGHINKYPSPTQYYDNVIVKAVEQINKAESCAIHVTVRPKKTSKKGKIIGAYFTVKFKLTHEDNINELLDTEWSEGEFSQYKDFVVKADIIELCTNPKQVKKIVIACNKKVEVANCKLLAWQYAYVIFDKFKKEREVRKGTVGEIGSPVGFYLKMIETSSIGVTETLFQKMIQRKKIPFADEYELYDKFVKK